MKIILIGLLIMSTVNAYADTKTCPVDDRINDLSAVIADVDAGKLQKSVQINAETFIELKPKVISLLKERYEIVKPDCSIIKVIAGEPFESVEVDFTALFNEVVKSISAKDEARTKWLVATFKAAPMTAEKAFGALLVPAPVPGQISDQLATLLNINKLPGIPVRIEGSNESTVESFVLLSDVFRSLGGKLTGELKTKVSTYQFGQQFNRDPAAFKKAAVQSMGAMKYDINSLITN